MKVAIRFEAEYRYAKTVSFAPHRFRLFPRADHFTLVRRADFRTNEGADVQYRRDIFDNPIASCFYPDEAAVLACHLDLELILAERNAFHFLLAEEAMSLPFEYPSRDCTVLAPYVAQRYDPASLPFWSRGTAPRPTVEVLVELNRAIFDNIAYERREEGEARTPAQTLSAGRGACRDLTVLLAETLRGLGLAARMASGYLCELESGDKRAEGALHAWVEVCLPGAGWIGMDPTNGSLCNHNHITAAVGLTPEDVSPISGTYFHHEKVDSEMISRLELLECRD